MGADASASAHKHPESADSRVGAARRRACSGCSHTIGNGPQNATLLPHRESHPSEVGDEPDQLGGSDDSFQSRGKSSPAGPGRFRSRHHRKHLALVLVDVRERAHDDVSGGERAPFVGPRQHLARAVQVVVG